MIRIPQNNVTAAVMNIGIAMCLFISWRTLARAEDGFQQITESSLRQYCFDCHSQGEVNGGIDLKRLIDEFDVGRQFRTWDKVAHALETNSMPPREVLQPPDSTREQLGNQIRTVISRYIVEHAGDPGPKTIRRLNSAEYGYTIKDLIGLDLGIERSFVNDAVGGEGFTNAGIAQFMDDAALERYLDGAKIIALHAVIGSGPIYFNVDPGQTGKELSAIQRIQQIYRRHGFRTGAGEGAQPFGLDLYSRAFRVAWQYLHRVSLREPEWTLAQLAKRDGMSSRFCEHVWQTLNKPTPSFPLSVVVAQWRKLPEPTSSQGGVTPSNVCEACDQLGHSLRELQHMLASSSKNEEEAPVLTAGSFKVSSKQSFRATINWTSGADVARFELSVSSVSDTPAADALVLWRNAKVTFRNEDNSRREPAPLLSHLTKDSIDRLALGKHPKGIDTSNNDFVIGGDKSVYLDLVVPKNTRSGQLTVNVELDTNNSTDHLVRCRIIDSHVERQTAADAGVVSELLANPESPQVDQWIQGVALFASLLPEVSHREPAPSDRDPILPLFDNTYNKSERNYFHTATKYFRDDRFLVEHILDEDSLRQLENSWTDLLTSFEYHAEIFRFLMKKHRISSNVDDPWFEVDLKLLPLEASRCAEGLRNEYNAMQRRLREAEPRHVDDVLKLARQAWRRPLSRSEQERLRQFYNASRNAHEQDHTKAIRSLLVRVLISPEFLYLAEPIPAKRLSKNDERIETSVGEVVRLSDRELANRLSYFLWSSLPDAELQGIADEKRLGNPDELAKQTRRMLVDPRARRLAAEFFGQWLGFYRFEDFKGIDAKRFPEFDEMLRGNLFDESVSFFEHVIREDRPVREILHADYAFLNQRLADHYSIPWSNLPDESLLRVEGVEKHHRGGVLGMGALHAITSAPLRTSAVKRGDWILRRLLGSPVPPPPADAGSIAADDVQNDRLTVRKRLELHRTNSACQNCHSRIDPLGFALENFDPIGRWRDTYRDGQAIDPSGTLLDGTNVVGWDGLQNVMRKQLPLFERTLVVKLLGYALGRAELLSDQPLIEQIAASLQRKGNFSDVVISIVTSRQFTHHRQ
ncbi:MAG TPA: DUF1592 domain-containing protein [Pirellula sp.]|nr:DUF1592 domain-containing protein [Pirellula sp.]